MAVVPYSRYWLSAFYAVARPPAAFAAIAILIRSFSTTGHTANAAEIIVVNRVHYYHLIRDLHRAQSVSFAASSSSLSIFRHLPQIFSDGSGSLDGILFITSIATTPSNTIKSVKFIVLAEGLRFEGLRFDLKKP